MSEPSVRRIVGPASEDRPPQPSTAAQQILVLADAVEDHDHGTRGHSERVRTFTDIIAIQIGLDAGDRERLRWAALLHDVGKITIAATTLNKVDAPTPEEWAEVERHPEEGARLTAALRPWLGRWANVIEQHHERWDGAGYPFGLSGEAISLGARIVAVADAYETMTSGRPYQHALSVGAARAELQRCAGTQFDPSVVRAFLGLSPRRVAQHVALRASATTNHPAGAVGVARQRHAT
jgi:putative nucleotidyltransferase with HDIG domain